MIDRRSHARHPISGLVLAALLVTASCGTAQPVTVPPAPSTTGQLASPALTPGSTPGPRPSPSKPPPTSRPSPNPLPTATLTPAPLPTATATPRPIPVPSVKPTPRPTPRPTPTRTPPPPASTLIRHGPRTGHEVALTFDMGGRVGDALAIMRWLVDHRVEATVFMTGAMADNQYTDAGRQVLAIVDDHPDQFTLGNHSYTHADFRSLTTAEIRDELRRTEVALARYCSQDPRPFFRPPNGGYDADVLAAVGAAGYRDTVTWDIDTIDWRPINNDPPGPTAGQIVTKVLTNAQAGSIVLMHLGGYETFEALPRVVDGLQGAGYDLVTLDVMLGH